MISRRRFLISTGGLAATGALGGAAWELLAGGDPRRADSPGSAAATGAPSPAASTSTSATTGAPRAAGATDRVLVVVQMGGGNDALNTLVPLDGRYHDARPSLGLADADLVRIPGTGAYGLHPALAPLTPLLTAGTVAVVAGVGFPHPDRSHFAALDTWWSATPGQASSTGWLGRALDATATPTATPLRAVALGGGSPALTAEQVRATVVETPDGFVLRAPRRSDQARLLQAWRNASVGGSGLDGQARAATLDALAAVDMFATLGDAGRTEAGENPEQGDAGQEITRALATAAELVRADHGTQIVYVSAGGFDTHANQAATHQRLLEDLATGIAGFYANLERDGLAERVMLMTVSEFGRRAAENGSGGTDHGKAGVQFVVGPSVRGGVVGDLDLAHLDDGDLPAKIDVRSLYGDGLAWLGVAPDDVLGRGVEALGVATA